MKTEIDRVCGIMHTLLAYEPIIDVPYEKINDIAVALVKEGYGNISEYETEMETFRSKIKVLEQRLNDKYIEIDNLNHDYRKTFERVKTQRQDIEKLKADYEKLKTHAEMLAKGIRNLLNEKYELSDQVKQVQVDTINAIVKYCECPDHWIELKDCKLFGGKSDDLRNFLNGIFKDVEDDNT